MLFNQILKDLKQAQLQKDEIKVSTLRMLLSEIKYAALSLRSNANLSTLTDSAVDNQLGDNLPDDHIITVIQKEAKKRKEAILGYRQGNREDQAQKEEAELAILEHYLPKQLEDDQLQNIVETTIKELGAVKLADMGKVIASVRAKVGSSADGSRISLAVKNKLTN